MENNAIMARESMTSRRSRFQSFDDRLKREREAVKKWERDCAWARAKVPELHSDNLANTLTNHEGWRLNWNILQNAIGRGAVLALLGPRGVGKTQMAAAAISHVIYEHNKTARYCRATDLFRDVFETYGKNSMCTEAQAIDKYRQVSLLVIDELNVRRETKEECRILTDLVDARYFSRRTTILISNQNPDSFCESIGTSISDRLQEGGVLTFNWDSFRGAA